MATSLVDYISNGKSSARHIQPIIMAETAAAAPAKKAVAKKPKAAKPAHPKTSLMVADAIKALKDRKGSSLAAIKKHVAANNKVDADKIAPFIRRYLKKAVADGTLVQVKGNGANGSFKLAAAAKEPKKPKTPKKKPAAKKPAAKKAATPKKKKAVKKTATKSKKEKKPAKSPKKPKAPKPKKAASKPKAKKAAPKKK